MDIRSFFSKETRRGRTVRTFLQSMIGIMAFVTGLLALPGVSEYLTQNKVLSAATLAAIIAVTTYVYNALEQLLVWLASDSE